MKTGLAATLTAAAIWVAFALPVLADRDPSPDGDAALRVVAERLSLRDIEVHPGAEGAGLTGRLPGGEWLDLVFHRDGSLEGLEAGAHRLAPVSEVTSVLPGPLLRAERFPADAMFERIGLGVDGYAIAGRDHNGRRFEVDYDRDGRVKRWRSE